MGRNGRLGTLSGGDISPFGDVLGTRGGSRGQLPLPLHSDRIQNRQTRAAVDTGVRLALHGLYGTDHHKGAIQSAFEAGVWRGRTRRQLGARQQRSKIGRDDQRVRCGDGKYCN